jgi:hypothetical protein
MMQDRTLDLPDLARLVAQQWEDRPTAERDAFVRRLAGVATPLAVPSTVIDRVLSRSALSGAVHPQDLVTGLPSTDVDRLLSNLAPQFDRVALEGRWMWTLRSGTRASVLTRLAKGDIEAALADVSVVPTDTAGELLRDIAGQPRGDRGRWMTAALIHGLAPSTVTQALMWALPLGGVPGALAEVRRRTQVQELADGYRFLLAYGVYGRDAELDWLRTFAEAPAPKGPGVPLLPVAGLGGSGKSTVLAAFIQPYLAQLLDGDSAALPVVVIDFDRALFRGYADLELSYEVTRQLGCAVPVAGPDFSALRYQHRQERQRAGEDQFSGRYSAGGVLRSAQAFETEAARVVHLHKIERRPVLLVLDTFEEWQRDQNREHAGPHPRNAAELRIIDWVGRLRSHMGLGGLRVVVSGRAELDPSVTGGYQTLNLGDLAPPDAMALVRAHDVDERLAATLVSAVGGNPLTLRVATRFVGSLSPEARTRFLEESRESIQDVDAAVRRAVLYDRFLNHIEDPQVRKLAHPGLALRRVTPALVQHLLAEACGLGPIDERTAEELTNRLADEVWLVRQAPDGLRHQPDIRRAMLAMMASDPAHAATVQWIHAAAARWYAGDNERRFGAGAWQSLGPEACQDEALYHQLMLASDGEPLPGTVSDDASWVRHAVALGEAVEELPAHVATQVRALRGDDISAAASTTLSDGIWSGWVARLGGRLADASTARELVALVHAGWRSGRPRQEPPWFAEAYCTLGRWEAYWRDIGGSVPPRRGTVDRYAMINAIMADSWGLVLRQREKTGLPKRDIESGEWLDDRFFDLLVTPGQNPAGGAGERRESWPRLRSKFPVDQQRWMLYWLSIPDLQRPMRATVLETAAIFRPDPSWIELVGRLVWRYTPAVRQFLTRFTAATPGLRTDEVLGEWAVQFANAVGGQLVLDDGSFVEEPTLMTVLRGDNPELRPAVYLALLEAVERDPGLLPVLGEFANRVVPCPVQDLRSAVLAGLPGAAVRRVLTSLVEYVDRSGVLARFVVEAAALLPGDAQLLRVRNAVVRWEQLNQRLCEVLARRLRPY